MQILHTYIWVYLYIALWIIMQMDTATGVGERQYEGEITLGAMPRCWLLGYASLSVG